MASWNASRVGYEMVLTQLAGRIEKEYEEAQQSLETQDRIVQGQWEQLKGLH